MPHRNSFVPSFTKWTHAAAMLCALLAAVHTGSLAAQRLGPPPKRPNIAGADTNNAHAYLDFGLRMISQNAGAAASAFYWAARIDPGLADALHGRRIAMVLDDAGLMQKVMTSNGRNPSKAQQQLDSLQLRALMLNPFIYSQLDLLMLQTFYRQQIDRNNPGSERPSPLEVDYAIEKYLREAGPYMRGWMAYAHGDFPLALSSYAEAMKGVKETAGIRVERGRIFGMRGEADSAIAEFQKALVELRKKDAKNVVVLYNSKAVIEQAIGIMLEQKNDAAGAHEAFGRALQEDLSYWPAHISLGMAAVTAHDTATAVSEFALATDIAPDEPYVQALVGTTLVNLGRPREAIVSLRKAIALEPYYALPNVALGRLLENSAPAEAAVAYQAFLARASRTDPQRAFAEERLAALKKP